MAHREPLIAWLSGQPVARVESGQAGRVSITYGDEALDGQRLGRPCLSCSLPLRHGRQDATAFVDGLLPEGDHRRHLAERADIRSSDSFGLISRYGRDIAGAVQFLPEGHGADDDSRWRLEPLDRATLDRLVDELPTNALAIVDESELSIDGMQSKMLLVANGDGTWSRPLGGRPSTHILKRDHQVHRGIVAAEHEALALALHAGLTTVASSIEKLAGHDCLIVERFDRVVATDGSVLRRIHQEDACQALGIDPRRKYEVRQGGGGPDLASVAELLDRFSSERTRQLDVLAGAVAFNALIGNGDAHGKNVAFLIADDGTIRLAPLYDTVPTILWPLVKESAMSVGGAVSLEAINLDAIGREAKSWRHSERSAIGAARTVIELVIDGLDAGVVDPAGKLATYIRTSARRMTSE